MKPKTKAFADDILANPKKPQYKAYLDTHETKSVKTASIESTRLLKKPSVRIYMKKAEQMAKSNVVMIANDKTIKADTRLKANQDILDRNLGKPTTRTESSNLNLNLNVTPDMTLSEDFTAFLLQKTYLEASKSKNL